MSAYSRSRINTFAAAAIERMSEYRDDAAWISARRSHSLAHYLLLDPHGHALVQVEAPRLLLLNAAQYAERVADIEPSFLGSTESGDYFMCAADAQTAANIGGEFRGKFLDLRSAGFHLPAFEASLFAYARGLAYWQSQIRFCNRCASPTALESAGHKAKCGQCGTEHFPRTDPAIIVIVSHADSCLLGRQPSWPERRYSTLAGFVEPGETLEDAVRREVFEEAGVRVTDCEYHSSQPWPFPASIMLGFTATAQDRTIQVSSELADARWFTAKQIIDGLARRDLVLPPPLSVSYRLIEHWLRITANLELAQFLNDEPWSPN